MLSRLPSITWYMHKRQVLDDFIFRKPLMILHEYFLSCKVESHFFEDLDESYTLRFPFCSRQVLNDWHHNYVCLFIWWRPELVASDFALASVPLFSFTNVFFFISIWSITDILTCEILVYGPTPISNTIPLSSAILALLLPIGEVAGSAPRNGFHLCAIDNLETSTHRMKMKHDTSAMPLTIHHELKGRDSF